MESRTKETRNQERKKFVEHNLQVEESLFHAIVTLAEDKVVTAANIAALATAAEALIEVQKRIV